MLTTNPASAQRWALVALAIIVLLPFADRAAAQNQPPATIPAPDTTVVAVVDGEKIYLKSVLSQIARLPEQYRQAPMHVIFPTLLERLIDAHLITKKARSAGYAENPRVKVRMQEAEAQIISEIYLTAAIEDRITEATLRARYDRFSATQADDVEVKARHILLETEEAANEVIEELEEGEDFAELAEERSTGPSASNGGDLGWFGAGAMVPEFSEAAFALEPETFTERPVKTQFGWHVILVEDRRTGSAPPFEEVREQLTREMTEELLQAMVAEFREGAKIQLFNFDGKPLTPAGQPKN